MSINNYNGFYLFTVLIFVLIIFIYNFKKSFPLFKVLSKMYNQHSYIRNYYIKKIMMILFFCLGLTSLIFSILDISWGQKAVEEERIKVRIGFVLDISKSMLTLDEGRTINRLENAKNIISLISNNFENVEFSLTIFKGKSILALPFSKDKASLYKILNYIEPSLISSSGSFLGDAVLSSVKEMRDVSYYNFLVVLSDGDEWGENNYYRFSKITDASKIKSFIVGVGNEKPNFLMENGAYVRDKTDKLVKTPINEDNLVLLSSALSSSYYNLYSNGTNFVINDIKNEITKVSSSSIALTKVLRYKFFLLTALLCIMLYIVIKVVRWDETF